MTTTLAASAVTPELVEVYRSLIQPVARNDWTGLKASGVAAEALARRAFVDHERAAWEVVQLIEWHLQRRQNLRPTDPCTVIVLDRLYAVEDASILPRTVPSGLTPHEFCVFLKHELGQFGGAASQLMEVLKGGALGPADWRYLAYQWLSSTIDFPRAIAMASLSLPREQARLLYENLYDEAGRGDWSNSHFEQLRNFLNQLQIDPEDEETMLAWSVPEVLASTNTQYRLLWRKEPGWALGALYLTELLIPNDLTYIRSAMASLALPDQSLNYFHEHIELDVEHAAEWLGVIECLISDHASQQIVFEAAMQQGRAQRTAWDAALAGWQRWKETGLPPHLPLESLVS